MAGFALLLAVWAGFGVLGSCLAYRGSLRRYGKDIYGCPLYVASALFGFAGFLGSMVAW